MVPATSWIYTLLLICHTVFARIGYFWHITDIHYESQFSLNGDARRNCWSRVIGQSGGHGPPRKPDGRFGDFYCDSPWALVESAAQAMKTKHGGDNIEFILWTGDGLPHQGKGNHAEQIARLQNTTDLLRHTFSSQFIFPVLGHDDPGPHSSEHGYRDVAKLWNNWLPTDALVSFKKGGYYTIEQKEHKLRIIALNTNLCLRSDEQDPHGQWRWLEGVLKKSSQNRETVYLVGHHPPGVDERLSSASTLTPRTSFDNKFNIRYLDLIRRYADIIVGQFFGHHHSDSFRVIYSSKGIPVSWVMIAPSVSPRRINHSGTNNPGLRLYKFDTNTGKVLDYAQYYLDLRSANERGVAEWRLEYNLTSYYQLPEVSAPALHKLAESFTEAGLGQQLFHRYYIANSVRLHSTGVCDASCAHSHYCSITRVEYTEWRSCLEAPPASALAASANANAQTPWVTRAAALLTSMVLHYALHGLLS